MVMGCFSAFSLQGEALGFSIWWGDEVHLCKVLWLSATSEGEIFIFIFISVLALFKKKKIVYVFL